MLKKVKFCQIQSTTIPVEFLVWTGWDIVLKRVGCWLQTPTVYWKLSTILHLISELVSRWESWLKFSKSQSNIQAKRIKTRFTGNALYDKASFQAAQSILWMLSGSDFVITNPWKWPSKKQYNSVCLTVQGSRDCLQIWSTLKVKL